MNVPRYLIVHHTAINPPQTFEEINEYHKLRFNFISSLGFYCGYQYFIDKFGNIKQARADNEEGAHTIGKNKESIGICLAGNFDLTLPTKEQADSLLVLLERLSAFYAIPLENIVPHRRFAAKSCYGSMLSDDWAASLVRKKYQTIIDALKEKVATLFELMFGKRSV